MRLLGLNLGYLSTAALFTENRISACVSEERFSRKKNDEAYPKQAIEFCLEQAGAAHPIDQVVIGSLGADIWHRLARYYSGFSLAEKVEEQHRYWKPVLYDKAKLAWQELYRHKLDFDQYPGREKWEALIAQLSNSYYMTEDDAKKVNAFIVQTISDHTGIAQDKFTFIEHHSAHAAYAYFASPFRNKTLVLTIDAHGDGLSATASVAEGNSIRRFKEVSHRDFQLARLYRYLTLLMGMKPDEHEYKVMGLAPYAKPEIAKPAYEVFRKTMYVDGLDFKYHERPTDMYHYFRDKLEGMRFDGIAGALQRYSEELITEWVKNAVEHTGISQVVFAGGVAMNVKAMRELMDLPCISNLFVPPSCGDESLCMGAAYHYAAEKGESPKTLQNAYLGETVSEIDVEEVCRRVAEEGLPYEVTENVTAEKIAETLAQGRVVARCSGRMEFGARALGNRSILADPRSREMVAVINEKIKNRDFWMPFAPAMLRETANQYLVNPKGIEAPYMTIAFSTYEEVQKDMGAALHPSDFTARPQMVDRSTNPGFADILEAFQKKTGVPVLLNTSFNLHGEPIVRTAQDALRVFNLTYIDDLVIGNRMLSKGRS